jgi:hypothetical protein
LSLFFLFLFSPILIFINTSSVEETIAYCLLPFSGSYKAAEAQRSICAPTMASANREPSEKTLAGSVTSGTSDNKTKEAADEPSETTASETRTSETRERSSNEVPKEATLDTNDIEANIQRTITTNLFPVTNLDEGIVGWDSQDDPENPQNFSMAQKWGLLALMSAITFISPLASSTFSPAVSYVATDLHVTNETVLSFSVSIFLLGYAVSWPLQISSSVCRFRLLSPELN